MQRNARGTYERMQIARGMIGDRTVVGTKCQGNGGECRGMQGNASETYGV